VLQDLISARDQFVYRHQTALLAALERDCVPIVTQPAARVAATA